MNDPGPAPENLPIVGLIEICMAAGVKRTAVSAWRKRHPDFPEPVAELATGPIFWWPDVADWLTRTGRRTDAGWTREQVVATSEANSVRHRVRRWAAKIEKGPERKP